MIRAYKDFFTGNSGLEYLLQCPVDGNPPEKDLAEFLEHRRDFLREALNLPAIPIEDVASFFQVIADHREHFSSQLPNIVISTAWALSVFDGFPAVQETAFTPRDDTHVFFVGLFPSANLTPAIEQVPIEDLRPVARKIQEIERMIDITVEAPGLRMNPELRAQLLEKFGRPAFYGGALRDRIGQTMKDTSRDNHEALMKAMRLLEIPFWTRELKAERRNAGICGFQVDQPDTFF